MIEWAIVWGIAQMGGAIAAPSLQELAKSVPKDFVKDFFKDCLGGLVGEFKQDDLKKPMVWRLKNFYS
ncbi:hypothetical protein [[Limnothrix rosea] IAM M-220]|uniref:hypothetical protein n=1 Tax=[Limnothrix rosea] IAM M-220 TaxID=454133 RepID=UPI00095F4E19|nr:hypothetical protein [[Limnothrix rosea] IAM M-220]OKH12703.1 hypothetical protein NIES208_15905 [[Limnothrix rosea] IAM M-220]